MWSLLNSHSQQAASPQARRRSGAALRLPKSEHINSRRRGPIVEVVLDPSQVNRRTFRRTVLTARAPTLGCEEIRAKARSSSSRMASGASGRFFSPPLEGFVNLARGPLCDANRQSSGQSRELSFAKSSAPSMISPRSASPIAARSAASSSGPSSNVSPSSAAITCHVSAVLERRSLDHDFPGDDLSSGNSHNSRSYRSQHRRSSHGRVCQVVPENLSALTRSHE